MRIITVNAFKIEAKDTNLRAVVNRGLLHCFFRSTPIRTINNEDNPIPTLINMNVHDFTELGDGAANVSFIFSSYSSTSCSERAARSSRSSCQWLNLKNPKNSTLISSCSFCISMVAFAATPSSIRGPSSTVADSVPTNQLSSSSADLMASRITI